MYVNDRMIRICIFTCKCINIHIYIYVYKEENAAVPSVAAEAEDKFAFFKQVSAIYMARLVIYI
jgi:hypothetical protein